MTGHISLSKEMNAPSQAVWDLVSDLPAMGRWSDEHTGGRWVGKVNGPEVGAKFRGKNQSGLRRWSTTATVARSEPAQHFAFDVSVAGIPISAWSFQVDDTDTGCVVTQSWADHRPGWLKPFTSLITGVSDRGDYTQQAIADTLNRLAVDAEANHSR